MHQVGKGKTCAHQSSSATKMAGNVVGGVIGLGTMFLVAQYFGEIAGIDGNRAGGSAQSVNCTGAFTPVVVILLKAFQLACVRS